MNPVPGFAPRWAAPAGVRAFVTTRQGGFSRPPFDGFNLAHHVGDAPEAVAANRRLLREGLGLPAEPAWLGQEHGARCVRVGPEGAEAPRADAGLVTAPGAVAAVLTADCLPVILARPGAVAVAHAGWRGLSGGILEATVAALGGPDEVRAYLGPAIGPRAFEVGGEVRGAFVAAAREDAAAFHASGDRWLGDLYHLARNRLRRLGVSEARIAGGEACTFTESHRYFSHRRDGRTGRMATLAWLDPAP